MFRIMKQNAAASAFLPVRLFRRLRVCRKPVPAKRPGIICAAVAFPFSPLKGFLSSSDMSAKP